MSDLDRDALDRWITSPRYSEGTDVAWCHNPKCVNYNVAMTVGTISEYGRSYWSPEECPKCWGDWHEEPPPEEDDDDEAE